MDVEIRCSKLARVMGCLGSLFFNLPPEEDKPAAMEGTAAGELLRAMLETGNLDHPMSQASNKVTIDSDMRFYVRPIAEEILSRADSEIRCEQRIDWMTRAKIVVRGSYDVSYVMGERLVIDDLKYGWKIVEVFENWQLLGYAIGEVMRRQQWFKEIVVRIHQPRPHHEDGPVREWIIPYEELLKYKEMIERRMDQLVEGDKTLQTGAHCKYCPAAGEACPAFNKSFFAGIEYAHEFLQDEISDSELSRQLDLINRVDEIVKIKKDSIKQLAVDRIRAGKVIPNYTTEQSLSDRKWKAKVNPEIIKALTGKDIIETVMLSPAKAEKAGIPKDLIDKLVDRHSLGQKLVRKDGGQVGEKIFGKGAQS